MREKMTSKGQMSMGALLFAFILLIVGLSLTPTVANLSDVSASNLTGVAATLYSFVPLFWVILILGIVGAIGFAQWKKIN